MRIASSALLTVALIVCNPTRHGYWHSSQTVSRTDIVHVSLSTLDQWAECVRHLTGKPLLLANVQFAGILSCPASQQDLKTQIEGKAVLVPGDKWDLLIGKNFPGVDTPPEFWKSVTVKLSVKSWEPLKGSRQASASELRELSTAALQAIRPSLGVEPPIADKVDAHQPAEAVAKINLEMLFDIRRLSPTGPESIIGVLGQETGGVADGRLIYGEFRDGKPVFQWDSPRMTTRLLNLNYRDVNHDGVEEIVLMGFVPSRGTIGDLVIYTSAGEELTRQAGRPEGFTAPIITGGEVKFVPEGHGGPDLLEIPDESNEAKVETYAFKETYEKQSDESATTLNQQGIELMKAKSYVAAAAKFTQAFHVEPDVAEFANNIGFAWYRAGKLLDAVLWLQEATSLDPKRAIAYLNLGDAYAKLNRNAEARDAYKKYLELAPDSKSAPDVKKKLDTLPPSP
jgi:hypothetical protein